MTWLATIALLCVGVLLVYLGWCWGVWAERREQASREEAIRLQAYEKGRNSFIDEHNERMSMMAPEQLVNYHVVSYNQPKTERTKESS